MNTTLSKRTKAIIAFLAGAISFCSIALSSTPLLAQCSDGSEGDALGCAAQMAPQTLPSDVPSFSVSDRPSTRTPAADGSSEASAANSLGKAPGYTEDAVRSQKERAARLGPVARTEFQKFVAASTGKELAVFGEDLFSQRVSFNPVEGGAAAGEMIIAPKDELRIRVWGQVNFSANLRVSRQGDIYLPKVGSVHVAGLPFAAVSDHIQSVMTGVYKNFEISVDLGEIHSIQIYLTGFARLPGAYTISGLSTLLDAVFESGGPTAAGSMRHVLLKRDGKVVTDYDLYALMVNGDKTGDVQLLPGDVLYFPVVGPQVALLGSVRKEGIYELRGKESIAQVLEFAGGKSTIASDGHLSLERIENHATRRAVEIPADARGLATLLVDGDILRVDPIVSNFKKTVTLRGAVANPGKFGWHQGLRLSNLIPDRDAVVKRDYWWERTRLGLPTPELQAPAAHQSGEREPSAVSSPSAQTNWNYAVIERLDTGTMTTSLISFSLGKLVLDHDTSQDFELQPGDVVTIFSQNDIHIPVKEQTKYLRLEGEFVHPGVYSVGPNDTLRTVIAKAGGLTTQAYRYGSVFTRESTARLEEKQLAEFAAHVRQQFERNSISSAAAVNTIANDQAIAVSQDIIANLKRMRAMGRIVLNPSSSRLEDADIPDIQIEDGDTLEVPFTPATVQVIASGVARAFLFHDGGTVGEYLHLAGGVGRYSDAKNILVVRANGSIVGRHSVTHGFNELALHPGDSIMVPDKLVRPSAMAMALAWMQALTQTSMSGVEVHALTK